jgi:hypothetical protein
MTSPKNLSLTNSGLNKSKSQSLGISGILGQKLGPVTEPWTDIAVKILPLFNGEGLTGSIEELNELLRNYLANPSSGQNYLNNFQELLNEGLNSNNSEKFLPRLMEVWSFYFGTVIPYLQGVFLPYQESFQNGFGSYKDFSVRTLSLVAFRANIVLPHHSRLADAISRIMSEPDDLQVCSESLFRLIQMLCVMCEIRDSNTSLLHSTLLKVR